MTFPFSGFKCQKWEVEETGFEERRLSEGNQSERRNLPRKTVSKEIISFSELRKFINAHYFQLITLSEPLMGSCSLCSWERALTKQDNVVCHGAKNATRIQCSDRCVAPRISQIIRYIFTFKFHSADTCQSQMTQSPASSWVPGVITTENTWQSTYKQWCNEIPWKSNMRCYFAKSNMSVSRCSCAYINESWLISWCRCLKIPPHL